MANLTKWIPLFERKKMDKTDKAKAEKEKAKAKAEKEKAKEKAEKEKEKEKAKAKKSKMKENLDDGEVTDVEGDLRTKGEVDSKLQPYQPISLQ